MHEIWDMRLRASTPPADTTELKAFGAWFAAKQEDAAWALPELLKALRIQPDVDLEFLVLKRLAELAARFPSETVQALHLMVSGTSEHWRISVEKDAITSILTAAMIADEAARQIAVDTINRFGQSGVHIFRDLLRTPMS